MWAHGLHDYNVFLNNEMTIFEFTTFSNSYTKSLRMLEKGKVVKN